MFLRLLLLIGALALLWWAARRGDRRPRAAAPPASARVPAAPESMVRCAHCGVHLPGSEVLRDSAAQPYCCADHRRAGPRAPVA